MICWVLLTRDSDHDVSDYVRSRNNGVEGITVGVEVTDEACNELE
jgi:hypothetical protein